MEIIKMIIGDIKEMEMKAGFAGTAILIEQYWYKATILLLSYGFLYQAFQLMDSPLFPVSK